MEKPNVKLTDEWSQGVSVHTKSKDSMMPFEIKEGYEKMINELINSNKLISELLGIVIEPDAVKELKNQYYANAKALECAGCE